MGYYNSIFNMGIEEFTSKCVQVGVDGLIIVDLQPEEDADLYLKTKKSNIDLIRLITPTTNKERLKTILNNASGFILCYCHGITGQNSTNLKLETSINLIRSESNLPIVAGFGIKSRKDVENISAFTDGVVVGSSIVNIIKDNISDKKILEKIDSFTQDLKKGTDHELVNKFR